MTHINRERQREGARERVRQQKERIKGPLPNTGTHTHTHTQTHYKHTQRPASPWNMTAPRWRRWGWGKPYCNNLILWSLIVSCCFSLPDSVRWAYVKHISPLSVGALPASSSAAQRHKPWELLEADGPDNLPLGLQRQVRSQPERHRERARERCRPTGNVLWPRLRLPPRYTQNNRQGKSHITWMKRETFQQTSLSLSLLAEGQKAVKCYCLNVHRLLLWTTWISTSGLQMA